MPATERSVIEACKVGLADFKVPKRVMTVGELPRNAMGKVQKNLLREAHKELFAKPPPKAAQHSGVKP